MPESKLDIQVRDEGDVTVLTLKGEITLDDGDLLFRRVVHELLDQGRIKLVADIGEVTYIDSAGVGMIAGKLKTVRERGGDLQLARVTSKSTRLLGMMKLLLAFEVHVDAASAVRSFAWKDGRKV